MVWTGKHEFPIFLSTIRHLDAFQRYSCINIHLTQTQLFTPLLLLPQWINYMPYAPIDLDLFYLQCLSVVVMNICGSISLQERSSWSAVRSSVCGHYMAVGFQDLPKYLSWGHPHFPHAASRQWLSTMEMLGSGNTCPLLLPCRKASCWSSPGACQKSLRAASQKDLPDDLPFFSSLCTLPYNPISSINILQFEFNLGFYRPN